MDGDKILSPPDEVSLVNLLPMKISVILVEGNYGESRVQPIAFLEPYGNTKIKYPGSFYGTQITCVKEKDYLSVPLTMPIQFGDSKKYFFGGTSFNSFSADVNGYNLYADLPGVYIQNHFPFPITLTYRNLSFDIGENSWRDYKGGSEGIIYFDNQGQGLSVGSEFTVFMKKEGGGSQKLMEFKIPNKYVRNIHTGTVMQS